MKIQHKNRLLTGLSAGVLSLALATPALAGHNSHGSYGYDQYRKGYDQYRNGYSQYQNRDNGYRYSSGSRNNHADYARVTVVDPIYQTVSHQIPEQSCRVETRYEAVNQRRSHTPALLGAIIGGAIGNELGHKQVNKKVGVAVGGLLGASLGNDWSNNRRGYPQQTRAVNEEVCDTYYHTEHEQRVVGYNVQYRYKGRDYTTQMDHHPGDRIRVDVNVRPVY